MVYSARSISEAWAFEVRVAGRQPLEGVRTITSSTPHPEERRVRRTYGVKVVFRQRGVLGAWDLAHGVQFFLASLTFLTVAWSVCEILLDVVPVACRLRGSEEPAWVDFLYSRAKTKAA